MKRGPIGALEAMLGPKRLLAIWHRDAFEWARSRMRCDERTVARRMPILGQHHVIKAFGETVDNRHHGIAFGNRKRAARTEIVLHIDYQQQVIVGWSDLHARFLLIRREVWAGS